MKSLLTSAPRGGSGDSGAGGPSPCLSRSVFRELEPLVDQVGGEWKLFTDSASPVKNPFSSGGLGDSERDADGVRARLGGRVGI